MTPVSQTVCTFPGGNCFQACVASVLDLPLYDVPHFMEGSDGWWTQERWDAVRSFAASHGYRAFWIDPTAEPELVSLLDGSDLFYIAIGPSRGGDWGHCVVRHRGGDCHDPAEAGFLAGEPWLYVGFEPGADVEDEELVAVAACL